MGFVLESIYYFYSFWCLGVGSIWNCIYSLLLFGVIFRKFLILIGNFCIFGVSVGYIRCVFDIYIDIYISYWV